MRCGTSSGKKCKLSLSPSSAARDLLSSHMSLTHLWTSLLQACSVSSVLCGTSALCGTSSVRGSHCSAMAFFRLVLHISEKTGHNNNGANQLFCLVHCDRLQELCNGSQVELPYPVPFLPETVPSTDYFYAMSDIHPDKAWR